MSNFHLYVFDYNYSSWSMRAGLVMRVCGIPFQETAVREDDAKWQELRRISPSSRFPALMDGSLLVWDSLAIAEHLAERFPEQPLWPSDLARRATARSICAEMHSGFRALRAGMPMNLRAFYPGFVANAEVLADRARLISLLEGVLERSDGPFLFGTFGIADAFFAPIIMRFATYDVQLEGRLLDYATGLREHPAVVDWVARAKAQKLVEPEYHFSR